MRDDVIVHPVPAGEHAGHAGVVLLEDGARLLGEKRVLVAEEPVAERAVVVRDTVELVRLHLLEMGDRLLRDVELRLMSYFFVSQNEGFTQMRVNPCSCCA